MSKFYVRNCFVFGRKAMRGEECGALFTLRGGEVLASLDGYVILPLEEYCKLGVPAEHVKEAQRLLKASKRTRRKTKKEGKS